MPYGFLQDLNSSCSFMSKGLKIVSVCLEFAAFAAVGYFLGGIFLSDRTFDKVEYTEPEPLAEAPVEEIVPLSTVPVLLAEDISAPLRGSDGKYSFKAYAAVESGDSLEYILFSDAECTKQIASNGTGSFNNVPSSVSQTYYLCAQNVVTGDFSELIPVSGFVKVAMYERITKEELHRIINIEQTYEATPKGFSHRFAPSCKFVLNGAKPEDASLASIDEFCSKVMFRHWESVTIHDGIEYDSENRITKLVMTVNYPL